jgi:small subunit ribosomal protein S9
MAEKKTATKAPSKAVPKKTVSVKKAATTAAPKKTTPKKPKSPSAGAPLAHSVGRRKKSVARVWLRRGAGKIVVNGKSHKKYFDTEFTRLIAEKPFAVCPVGSSYDVQITVCGGGKHGQADAVKLGIARALVSLDEGQRKLMREHDLLTVDSRVKERKKYGQKAARRKFQFVKR